MTERELKRLSRANLLDMLIDQSMELQKAKKQLRAVREELGKREIALKNSGSIAEASLKLNGVFEAAQASCEQYLENIRSLSGRQEEICRRQEQECREKISRQMEECRLRCEAMEQETREKCARMLKKAKREARAYLEESQRR